MIDLVTDGAFPGVCGHSAFLKGQDYFDENYKITGKTTVWDEAGGTYVTVEVNENLNYYASLPALASSACPEPVAQSAGNPVETDISSPMYDLYGRQVTPQYRGVIVKNGRKIIVTP